jgi:hypothetical protein
MDFFCKKRPKKISPKKRVENVKFSKKKFWAIGVSQPICGMPAKIWGSRPAAQTVHKCFAKLLYRLFLKLVSEISK